MELEIISYDDLINPTNHTIVDKIKTALVQNGIVGIKNIPHFLETTRAYIKAAKQFSVLDKQIKDQYAPDRDKGETEGYELGAEWFKDQDGNWQIDNKKASFYAFVPDHHRNKWPREMDLKTPYLELGKLIFETGKHVLNYIGLNEQVGISHKDLVGYGRMLHYRQENDIANTNPDWCGAHFDHGIFTGLAPAHYFKGEDEIEEPEEAGLFILPTNEQDFVKVNTSDKSILLFQAGEFGQLATHDHIRATKHLVKKAKGNIERITFAQFFSASDNTVIHSRSELTKDTRYSENMNAEGGICFGKWHEASLARYRAV